VATVVRVGPGTPFPHLRYVGAATAPAEQQDQPAFLAALDRVGAALGRVIDIFSGSGGPDVRGGGGFAGDPHDRRIAADATIGGTPIGNYPRAVAAIHAQGLRSGATDFLYHGQPDPAHVDAVNPTDTSQSTLGDLTENSPGTSTGSGISSADDFWLAVEHQLGITGTRASHAFLISWAKAEGTSARYNPLATTLKLPGSTALGGNPDGVQQYASPEQGVQATAATIRQYPAILAGLKNPSYQTFDSPAVRRELNIWSGQRSAGARVTDYVRNVLLGYQGNPSGQDAEDPLWAPPGWVSAAAGKVKDTLTAPLKWGEAVVGIIGKLMDPHTWWRVGLILAGGVLVLAGVLTMAHGAGVSVPMPPVIPV
jgi:hypothetical protein